MFNFQEIPYHKWGPYRNHWGYIVTIAQFDDDDIILKTVTPNNKLRVSRYSDWEECEEELELIAEDRRF